MKYNKSLIGILLASSTFAFTGCSDSFLEPDPLSFYEPASTFTTESGLAAALAQVDRNLKMCWASGQDKAAIMNQFQFSDMMLIGTGNASSFNDMWGRLQPNMGTKELNDVNEHACYWYWNQGYAGIKYANTVIQYAPQVTGLDEATLNSYLGRAYFHRAFRYYSLVHEFGNVPLITKLPEVPKQNYKSCSRTEILKMIQEDMEFAVKWVPEQAPGSYTQEYPGGYVNKAACRMLLAKIYMANCEFDKALEQLNAIEANGYALMTEPFGVEVQTEAPQTWPITRNIIWDLHRHENVFNGANRELIYGLSNSGNNLLDYRSMRMFLPFYFDGKVHAPNGKQALANNPFSNKNWDPQFDWLHAAGRGIGSRRPSPWSQHGLWALHGKSDPTDLRHSSEVGNWLRMEDLTYNHNDTKNPDANGVVWYGQHLRLFDDNGNCLCEDTIRRWYNVPLYKLYAKDENRLINKNESQYNGVSKGSFGDMYFYRFAEVILLRAECYFYKGNGGAAAQELNKLRTRAHCTQLYTGDATIDDIFDERARELYLEEWRHDELVRASYCLAKTGLPDSRGIVYTLEEVEHSSGIDRDRGGSFWYQRCINYNLYNDGILYTPNGDRTNFYYTMGKENMFWPIPDVAITANDKAQLWQNYNYQGYDPSIEIWTDWHDAVADESTR